MQVTVTVMSGSPLGTYIRNQRVKCGISLRKLALGLGVTPVYLGEVERGIRSAIARERWDKLIELVPTITRDGLERHAANSTSLQLNLIDASPQYQNIGFALARRIEKRDLSEKECGTLLELLGRWKEEE